MASTSSLLARATGLLSQSLGRLPLRAVVAAAALLSILSLILISHRADPTYLPAWAAPNNARPGSDVIPNTVHFVYILADGREEFGFQFSHFLSIYAAWHYWKPQAIYLHTNARADGPAVARARDGRSGKWDRYIFSLFGLRVNTVAVPTHAGNGKELANMEHKSDFVRVRAVHDLGGVYIDWDVHALRDIAPVRESGFRAVAGRQLGGQLNSGTFLSAPGSRMISLWKERMHGAYTGGWTTHSNEVLTEVGERLVREPGEMLIMEREAFAPGSWETADSDMLFEVHNDTASNLEGVAQGDPLPAHDEAFSDRWDHPDQFPDWARDWSSTYLLHAFSPNRWGHKVPGFEHITPRYVLERQSNFARAVYPIAKIMYDRGLIQIDDSHLGT